MPDEFEEAPGPEDLNQPPSFFPTDDELPRQPGSMGELVEVQIDGVYQEETATSASLFVRLTDGERVLPIRIGGFEAHAINSTLEGVRPDRPMTHDLMRNILERLDVSVDRVVIDDLWNGIYYAKIYLKTAKEEIEIDARPSDALATAVRFGASIFVAEGILEESGDE